MKFRLLGVLVICIISGCSADPVKQYQEDADLIRLEHLEYWTEIINQYYQVKGGYPFQDDIQNSEDIVLVKIATNQQMQYLSSDGDKYEKRLDNNISGYFKERSVKKFVAELEAVLGHQIEEKYDIQKVPTSSPVGYYYFVSEDGYLVWVTCITCGVTQISTLLMDGVTPTVNIVSKDMVGKVTKALTREEMLNHPTYKSWVSRPFHNGEAVHNLVKESSRDSK